MSGVLRAFSESDVRAENMRRTLALMALPLLAMAVWSGIWVAHVSAHGMGASPDSAVYLSVANNIRDGRGPTSSFAGLVDSYGPARIVEFHGKVPETHYPPGYPIALAVLSVPAGSVTAAARVMGIVLAPVNLVLLALLTARMTGYRSWLVPLVPPLLVIFIQDTTFFAYTAQGWLPGHGTVWSEPLFTALSTSMLLVFPSCLSDGARARRAFVAVTVLAAAALLTRYVGLADVVAGAFALVFLDRSRAWRARLVRGGAFSAIACAPLGVFLVWSSVVGGSNARALAYHPLPVFRGKILSELGQLIFDGFWSRPVREWAFVGVLVLVGVCMVRPPRRSAALWRGEASSYRTIVLVAVALVSYVVVVWLSRTFFDAALLVDARLLIPVRGLLYALVAAVAYRVLSGYAPQLVASMGVVALAAVPAVHNWPQQKSILHSYVELHATVGSVDRVVAKLPGDALIVSASSENTYLVSHRGSVVLPQRALYGTGAVNHRYGAQVRELVVLLRERGGYIVVPNTPTDPLPPALRRNVSLEVVARDSQETLYHVRRVASS